MSLVFYYHDPMEKTEPDFLRDALQKDRRQQPQAATREMLFGNTEKKNHCSRTSASLKQGLKGAVQSPAPMVLKTRQDFEQPDLILKLALL